MDRKFMMSACVLAMALLATADRGIQAAQAPATKVPATDAYRKVDIHDPDVQAAVKSSVADEQRKNGGRLRLLSVISAERQYVSGNNLRLCLSMDRSGRAEFARIVLSRNSKKQWSVTVLSWGSCGR